jgi:hypothetical protein
MKPKCGVKLTKQQIREMQLYKGIGVVNATNTGNEFLHTSGCYHVPAKISSSDDNDDNETFIARYREMK